MIRVKCDYTDFDIGIRIDYKLAHVTKRPRALARIKYRPFDYRFAPNK